MADDGICHLDHVGWDHLDRKPSPVGMWIHYWKRLELDPQATGNCSYDWCHLLPYYFLLKTCGMWETWKYPSTDVKGTFFNKTLRHQKGLWQETNSNCCMWKHVKTQHIVKQHKLVVAYCCVYPHNHIHIYQCLERVPVVRFSVEYVACR